MANYRRGRTSVSDLSKQVGELLQSVSDDVLGVVQTRSEAVAGEARKRIQSDSRELTGRYRRSWAVAEEHIRGMEAVYIVHNRRHYRLTHLLEHGHIIVKTGGRTRAFPHIGPAADWAQRELPKRIEEGIVNEIIGR